MVRAEGESEGTTVMWIPGDDERASVDGLVDAEIQKNKIFL